MDETTEIEHLADAAGVLASYHDQAHKLIETPLLARRAVLEGLGFPVDTPAARARARERLSGLKEGLAPRVTSCVADQPSRIALRHRGASAVAWSITLEEGSTREGRGPLERSELALPALPAGYHRLSVEAGGLRAESLIIAAPSRCWRPPDLDGTERGFGFTAQIYGLRSPRQFGVGDFTDVGDLAAGLGRWGGSFLGLSPAHALFPSDASRYSPYSPSSRLFLQTLLVDPTALTTDSKSVIRETLERASLERLLDEVREAPLVDYGSVWRLKQTLFEALWAHSAGRDDAGFESYREERGQALTDHATFQALSEHFAARGAPSSESWPQSLRDPRAPEVESFRREHADRVAFHAWLQWHADRQFENAHRRARAAGMSVGLYRDLAVGADRGGSEIWSAPSRYLASMSIGAPPDPLGPSGQNWGLPPFDPIALEEKELRPFRDLVDANMRHAGALRIDHAFQLQRLFLIPNGEATNKGAYVAYPLEVLLAVLRLESHRHQCLVIAEDLGTAPAGFSEAIMKAGVLSYRLLTFEREDGGGFVPPSRYPRDALAAASTHDLATVKGWWRGLDIDLRECFGFYGAERAERERRGRASERGLLLDALRQEGLSPPNEAQDHETAPTEACLRFLARTPCALTAIQIEDAIGESQQANLPGPSTGHPNWRRRLSLPVQAIVAPNGPAARASATCAMEGRGLSFPLRRLAAPAPTATYRLQLNKDFTFSDAAAIAPYLRRLGVSHVYASPITRAAPGSSHGYDVQDYDEINPELGGEDAFVAFSDALRAEGLGLIVDFVPNHMGVAGEGNRWWGSVLEWGPRSPEAAVFDINFESASCPDKVLLPVLGKPYDEALASGELSLRFDARRGAFELAYFDRRFPIAPDLYPELLHAGRAAASSGVDVLEDAACRFAALAKHPDAGIGERTAKAKAELARAIAEHSAARKAIEAGLSLYDPATQAGRDSLDALVARQNYRLAYWRLASSELNYRRFFDISTLAGVRVEDERVFGRMHRKLFRLAEEGRIQGVRLDHIDGLADPAGYLERLQSALGPGFYVVVEKILEPGEDLRAWPVAGTTGYDVLAELDQLFVDHAKESSFSELYVEASGDAAPYEDQLAEIKAHLAKTAFAGEVLNLTREALQIAAQAPRRGDLDAVTLREALIALLSAFPVYRTYMRDEGPDAQDAAVLDRAFATARRRAPPAHARALAFLDARLRAAPETDVERRFLRHFQQLTGPLMAKSLEDTLFYRFGRFIALNEVGGDPHRFGLSLDAFHDRMRARARDWPAALTATSTHDTKRGEDARARLLALSGAPDAWRAMWRVVCDDPAQTDGPDPQDAYFLFQSILAAVPPGLLFDQVGGEARAAFVNRLTAFVEKALRESKRHTSWTDQNADYEARARRWTERALRPGGPLDQMKEPLRAMALAGTRLSVARAVLKCALPGCPDLYQGTEQLDFSFVDPDNRRAVDYASRAAGLDALDPGARFSGQASDGALKQQAITRILADRRASPALYGFGSYEPISLEPGAAESLIAFRRNHGSDALVVVALLRFMGSSCTPPLGQIELEPGRWRNLLTGGTLQSQGSLPLEDALETWPAIALRKVN